jgi:hypothetical protein
MPKALIAPAVSPSGPAANVPDEVTPLPAVGASEMVELGWLPAPVNFGELLLAAFTGVTPVVAGVVVATGTEMLVVGAAMVGTEPALLGLELDVPLG